MTNTPTLDFFVLNYVHEDLFEVFGSVDGAVKSFVTESPSAPTLAGVIDRLLDDVAAQAVLVIEHLALLRDAARRAALAAGRRCDPH